MGEDKGHKYLEMRAFNASGELVKKRNHNFLELFRLYNIKDFFNFI